MKKHRANGLLQLLVLTALGAAVVLTLAWPQLPLARREAEPVEVSVILATADTAGWTNARLGMEQAAGQLRAEVRIVTLTTPGDTAEQAELARYEAERGADVLVVAPAGRLPDGVDAPVITMGSAGGAAAVCPDNGALGEALAGAVLADRPAGGVLLVRTAWDRGAGERADAARAALEEAGMQVTETLLADTARLEEALAASDAAAVLLFEPAATEAAAAAKEKLGLAPALYGVGSTGPIAAALERGTLAASGVWSEFAAGYLAVEGAVRLARGEDWQAQPLDFYILRGEDIYEPDFQKLLFPVAS